MNTYEEYRKQFNDAGKGLITESPTHIDIELSSACNFRCPMCPQAEPITAFKKSFMDPDLAMRLLREAREIGVRSIKLNWRGESTLHPQFAEIASLASQLGFDDVMLNTNGSYPYGGIVSYLIGDFNTVIFSIDTLDPLKAEIVRPGHPLEDVLENLEALVRSRDADKESTQIIRVNFTLQKTNADEIQAIKKYCHELLVDLAIRPVFPRNMPKVGLYFEGARKKIIGRKNCGFPFQRLVVSHDGLVAPCCVPWSNDFWVGDTAKKSIMEIWKSDELSSVRNDALTANYKNPVCINCTSWASYEVV